MPPPLAESRKRHYHFSRHVRARAIREGGAGAPRGRALASCRELLPVRSLDGPPTCPSYLRFSSFSLIDSLLCISQGVLLSLFFAFTLTPGCANKTSATSSQFVAAAVCNGVVDLAVSRIGSAPRSNNACARRPRCLHWSRRLANMCKADQPVGLCSCAPSVTASSSSTSNKDYTMATNTNAATTNTSDYLRVKLSIMLLLPTLLLLVLL